MDIGIHQYIHVHMSFCIYGGRTEKDESKVYLMLASGRSLLPPDDDTQKNDCRG